MDAIIKYLRDRKGYARMKDMKASGFQTRDIRKLVEDGQLVKVKAGLYRLADIRPGETTGLVEICLAMTGCFALSLFLTSKRKKSETSFRRFILISS